jgi:hypothetical protein
MCEMLKRSFTFATWEATVIGLAGVALEHLDGDGDAVFGS